MSIKDVIIKEIERDGRNITASVEIEGTIASFRLHYLDTTPRKNSRYSTYEVLDVYFEGFKGIKDFHPSQEISKVVDLCLFVERKSQWILERLIREGEK